MSSPFAARLGTNYCPKDEEILEIKTLLIEPYLRLKRLDDEIADLQRAIDKLAEERDGLGVFVEGHKALLSPVRRLPLDVIQEIFIACIPTHRNCVMSASEAPVLLGRICSSWRAISLSMPRLWARIHIVEPMRSRYGLRSELIDKKMAERLDITKTWLGRSGQCPLSISLQIGPEDSPPPTPSNSDPPGGQFLQALITFAPRWQHIRFASTIPALMVDDMARLTATDVPMLESVVFQLQQRFPPLPLEWERFEILRSPRISSFSTSGNSFIPEKIPIRWHQLTELIIDGPVWETLLTSEMVLQMFSRCPELRSCKLVINDHVGGIATQLLHSPVELRFLRTLELSFASMVSPVSHRLLERLSLPELRAFTLHGYADLQNSFSLAPFFPFWTRLESLNIDSNTFVKSSLLSTLQSVPPSLRRLSIFDITHGGSEFGSLDDDALAILAPRCPVLETLLISYCSEISDAALLKFIVARMTEVSIATLRRCHIQFHRPMVVDILPSLESFMESGLDVSLAYSPLHTTTGFSPWQGLADAPGPPFW